ncbi:hypothetical protein FRB98_008893 [Tulasnella sp. 332]|nr:hypothetical protein FRB98_008893 [Tulasnella sp. 332]
MPPRAPRGTSGAHHCQEPDCNRSFTLPKDLKRHITTVHQSLRNFSCPHCSKSFTQKGNLNTHIQAIHSSNKKPWRCSFPNCDVEFGDGAARRRHEIEQHADDLDSDEDEGLLPPVPNYECPDCEKEFKRKDKLKSHVLSRHPGKWQTYTPEQLQNRAVAKTKRLKDEIPEPGIFFKRTKAVFEPRAPTQMEPTPRRMWPLRSRTVGMGAPKDRGIEEAFAALDGLNGEPDDNEDDREPNDRAIEEAFAALDDLDEDKDSDEDDEDDEDDIDSVWGV